MRLKKSFELAFNVLLHSKLRSWLTIIGIIIGIAAVVSIISISQGAQSQLEQRLGGLGADILTITPGVSRAMGFGGEFRGDFEGFQREATTTSKNLTSKDVLVLKNINNVKYVMGQASGRGELAYESKSSSVSITGVDVSVWKDITSSTLKEGRFLSSGDSYSVVLGADLITRTFDNKITLNSKVSIEGKSFKVVGILESGNSAYIPMDIARIVLSLGNEKLDSISVKLANVDNVNDTITLIDKKLMISRGILDANNKDFSVSNPLEMQQNIQQTTQQMSLFLGAIAAISLLVGAIGIANTMFTSVLEKTKEIGIMKAIGAKNKDILMIFLLNSGLIGLVGGVGGIILGIFASGLISYWSSSLSGGGVTRIFGNTLITPGLLISALLFSIIIGMIAGAVPAYRASRLKPVDALRYE